MKVYSDLQKGLNQLTEWSSTNHEHPTLEGLNKQLDTMGHGLNYNNVAIGIQSALGESSTRIYPILETEVEKALFGLCNKIGECKDMISQMEESEVNPALLREIKAQGREWFTNLSLVGYNKDLYTKAQRKLETFVKMKELPEYVKLTCGTTHTTFDNHDGYAKSKRRTSVYTMKARRLNMEGINGIKETLANTVKSAEGLKVFFKETIEDWVRIHHGTALNKPNFIVTEHDSKMALMVNGVNQISFCMSKNTSMFTSIISEISD